MIRHPQVVANDILRQHEHPQAGTLRQTRPAATFSVTPPEHRFGAPEYAAHTAELLREVGYTDEQIEEMAEAGVVLQGETSVA